MVRAFLAGDRSFDGLFLAGVRTTGIFCRPSCPARKPKPENLEFFATARDAEAAGYRACLRCEPTRADGDIPDWLRPLHARMDAEPDRRWTADDLRHLGLEPARVRRWFQQRHGRTFAAHGREMRLGRALHTLRAGGSLDDAALGHGFDSHSGFREAFARHFSRTPGNARSADCLLAEVVPSPLGPLLIAASDAGIGLLEFSDPMRLEVTMGRHQQRSELPLVPGQHPLLEKLKAELVDYFAGRRQQFTVPLHAPGTPFQERVWAGLGRIPYGTTWSYADLARYVGQPRASRAIGLANGANRIAILIPCHRVVNTGGTLGGYGGGLWRKRLLLELERTGKPIGSAEVERPTAP